VVDVCAVVRDLNYVLEAEQKRKPQPYDIQIHGQLYGMTANAQRNMRDKGFQQFEVRQALLKPEHIKPSRQYPGCMVYERGRVGVAVGMQWATPTIVGVLRSGSVKSR